MDFDFATLDPKDAYKLLTATIVPRPIAWVVTRNRQSRLNAAPFSFFNVFSGSPPIICIGVSGREGSYKDTAANILETEEMVINLVSAGLVEKMNVTAIDFPSTVDELVEAGLTTAPSLKIGTPRIAESPVALECRMEQNIELGGGRLLIVGRVLEMHVRDDAVLDPTHCYIDTPKLDLVGRMHGGGWYANTQTLFNLDRLSVDTWAGKAGA